MIVPPSALLDGLLSVWPYLVGASVFAVAVGFAVPVKKKRHEEPVKTVVREEIQNDIKVVTKVHKEKIEIPYDVVLKMLSDYEKIKQDAQKTVLTQWALLEAKMEEERDKLLRDLSNPDLAYKDLVKVRKVNNGKRKKEEEGEEEEVDVDTSELYQA